MLDEKLLQRYFELAKLNASTDGAFDDKLMQHWFLAAWSLCAEMIGWHPPQNVVEPVTVDLRGNILLSFRPSSVVEFYDGYTKVGQLPANNQRSLCDVGLCCFCNLTAHYRTGGPDACDVSPRFVEAVCRLFAYMVENRGDAELDDQVLAKSGALAFLRPDLTFVV